MIYIFSVPLSTRLLGQIGLSIEVKVRAPLVQCNSIRLQLSRVWDWTRQLKSQTTNHQHLRSDVWLPHIDFIHSSTIFDF